MTRTRISFTAALLLFFALACAMPSLPMDDATFNTSVAQTVNAGLTKNYVSPTFTLTPSITWTPTITVIPTETLTPTGTTTPTFPFNPTTEDTLTSVVLLPQVIVSVSTNCRSGPGKEYEIQGTLMRGESADVHGIDPTGKYWYIRNPDPGAPRCWISGRYANFVGSTLLIPVMSPVPTPTSTVTLTPVPKFRANFVSLGYCGTWWANINLQNTGQAIFKSAKISVKDNFSAERRSKITDGFIVVEGCDGSTSVETLEPGAIVTVSAPEFSFNLGDRRLDVTIMLCTDFKLAGTCTTLDFWFKP